MSTQPSRHHAPAPVSPSNAAAHLLVGVRHQLRLTQRQVADAAGFAPSTYAAYETARTIPSITQLARILAALDVPLALVAQLPTHDVTVTTTGNSP